MLTVTPAALDKLGEVLDTRTTDSRNVRVSVVRGPHGCVHGWTLGIEDRARPEDSVLDFERLHILVEPQLANALEGATIDYREDAGVIGFAIEVSGNGDHGGCNH